jgi:hypothetical protein
MPVRIRHCVECPQCHTRYLAAVSQYRNGSYLESRLIASSDEYTLYCACGKPPVFIRGRWGELKKYVVSRSAYDRGYGTPDEIVAVDSGRSSVVSRRENLKTGDLRRAPALQKQ